MKKEQKTYIVLGMGRSGSTFLAGALKGKGVDIGKNQWHDLNENLDFVDLNKKIFKEFGINGNLGDIPPTAEQIISVKEKYQDEFRTLFFNMTEKMNCVKDPRMTITAPIWLPALLEFDDDPFFYVTFRGIEKTAESLQEKITEKGYNYDIGQGKRVAEEYHKRVKDFVNLICTYTAYTK